MRPGERRFPCNGRPVTGHARKLAGPTTSQPGYRESPDRGRCGRTPCRDSAHLELIEAVRAAAAGEQHLAPAVAAGLEHSPAPERPVLSPRETDVLRLMALGHTNREIGEQQLGLSVRTVETHRLTSSRSWDCRAGRS
jgi:hypothetical protein